MTDQDDVRRSRRALAVAAAVAVLLVAAGVVVVPRLLGSDAPSPEPGTDCVADTSAPSDRIGTVAATWVRFCPLAGSEGQRVRHPQGAITGDLAASIAATLWETQVDRPVCDPGQDVGARPHGRFRIEVGLADGTVADLAGDTGCSTRDALLFSQLETTLLMDAGAVGAPAPSPAAAPPPALVTCPDRLTTAETNRDGTSAEQLVETAEQPWLSTLPFLPMPAVAADVCAYTGRGRSRTLVDQWQVTSPRAEEIRAVATTGYLPGAVADCDIDPARTSYVVVLTDATGTARSLALDTTECATFSAAIGTPPVDTPLGLARQRLVRLVARSHP